MIPCTTAWRSPGYWHLKMDEIEVMEKVKGVPDEEHASLQDDTKRQKESTDVRLHGMPAFLGGRPGKSYTLMQYTPECDPIIHQR